MTFENWVWWALTMALWALALSIIMDGTPAQEAVQKTWFGRFAERLIGGLGRWFEKVWAVTSGGIETAMRRVSYAVLGFIGYAYRLIRPTQRGRRRAL